MADLQRMRPDTAVVLLAADPGLLPVMVRSGAFAFMRKPVNWEYCLRVLQHAMVHYTMSKAIGGLKGRLEEISRARAGLLRLVEQELAESGRQWNPKP